MSVSHPTDARAAVPANPPFAGRWRRPRGRIGGSSASTARPSASSRSAASPSSSASSASWSSSAPRRCRSSAARRAGPRGTHRAGAAARRQRSPASDRGARRRRVRPLRLRRSSADGTVAFFDRGTGARALEIVRAVARRRDGHAVVALAARRLRRARHRATGAWRCCRSRFAPVLRGRRSSRRRRSTSRARRGRARSRQAAASAACVVSSKTATASSSPVRSATSEIALWWTDDDGAEQRRAVVRVRTAQKVTARRASAAPARPSPAPTRGKVYHWELGDDARRSPTSSHGRRPRRSPRSSTSSASNTFIVGTGDGQRQRLVPRAGRRRRRRSRMVRAHEFEPQGSAITAIAASTRDRTLRHGRRRRSRRPAAPDLRADAARRCRARRRPAHGGPDAAERRPARGARRTARIDRFAICQPASRRSAGRRCSARSGTRATRSPSTSGSRPARTDDFEPKFSLVPLIFGTIKGTFYALLFAIPLAVLGALYTSQFVHPTHPRADQADGRDHGGAAERRDRLHRRPVSRAGRRAQPGRACC